MNRKLNNKGFTLVELLAVLAILIAIMSIAIPVISSSLERTKDKQDESRERVIESAAELYVADHKNAIYSKLDANGKNCINIDIDLINYLTEEEKMDSDNKPKEGYVIFTRPSTYNYSDASDSNCFNWEG